MSEPDHEPAEQSQIFPDEEIAGTGEPHPWPFLHTANQPTPA